MEDWIKDTRAKSKHPRLIVVDTLALFRKLASGKDAYQQDYTAVAELQKLASKYNLTIIVVHHDRKNGADDVFDTVSGTLGLTGAADTIAILKREASGVTLHIRGRDVEDVEKALKFDKTTCRCTILGDASEIRRSNERASVLAALEEAGGPLTISEIVSLGHLVNRNAADQLLHRMAGDGEVLRIRRGLYDLPGRPVSKGLGKKHKIDTSDPKSAIKQSDNDRSDDLRHLTQVSGGESSAVLGAYAFNLDDDV